MLAEKTNLCGIEYKNEKLNFTEWNVGAEKYKTKIN